MGSTLLGVTPVAPVTPYSQWIAEHPSYIPSGKVTATTQRYLCLTVLIVGLLTASTQRERVSDHFKRCRKYFIDSSMGKKIHSFYMTCSIRRAYYIGDALYADIIPSTLVTHSRLHIKTLAGLLRKYPHATKMLSLSVTDRSVPGKDQETAAREFASTLLIQFVKQESLKDHPLFQHAPEGYRLIPMHRHILSEEDIAICLDIGTILGAWGVSPFLQEYKLGESGHLFPTYFYKGLIFLIRYHSEWLEQPFHELSRQDREEICLFLANTTVGHSLYGIPWQKGFEICSDQQLHTLWNLMIETLGQQIIEESAWKETLRYDSDTIQWMRGYLQGYSYKTCYAQATALHAVAQGMRAAWPGLKKYLDKNFAFNENAAGVLSERIQGVYLLSKKRKS